MKYLSRHLAAAVVFAASSLSAAPFALAATPSNQLVIGTSLAQVLSLDPQQGTEAKALEILANTYDKLLTSDPTKNNELVPELAERWEADEKGITFHLREANFVSGNPVTANDVVYSLVRLMKMNQAAALNFKRVGYNGDNIEALARALDEHTFRIDFAEPMAADLLLYRLSMVVASVVDSEEVKKHVENDDYGNTWLRTHTAGSGPFTLNRWTPNDIVILQANPEFWGGEPAMKRVIMRHVPESQAERLMLERGDIDIANGMTAADLAVFDKRDGFVIQRVETGGFYVLSMNASRKELSNPLVREAIAYGIDYKGMENTILGPYGKARNVPVPESWPGAIANPDWGFNPEKAKALLAEAGYRDGFTLTLKTIAQTPRIDMATAIQASLGEIGIKVNIEQGNGADIIAAHRARNFDLLIPQTSAYIPNAIGSMEQFASNPDNSKEANNAGNFVWRSAWDIPNLTKLTASANSETDMAKRDAIFKQMQEMFVSLKPATLPLFERFEPIVLSSRIQGYHGHPLAAVRLNLVTKTDAD
ncbi:ABC transporter substrate-binding protein [Rhizobium sp. S152]|uniref:ABC transporter substrate-binding protein n=1 Tax=Rhizobium sp. S152 TaxID=3055038 RepID=UPI0025A96C2B|nr:ABC transporter substrate-binding protein [Rhizobium sp. S152]MDM9624671.1 ABC transporter substrate-binding protein [Rhizobium sp. S152]